MNFLAGEGLARRCGRGPAGLYVTQSTSAMVRATDLYERGALRGRLGRPLLATPVIESQDLSGSK
jgi:hypothetical protein